VADQAEAKIFDAIVMAGDRGSYKPVYGTHKALLRVAGEPVLSHVLGALDACRYVARIFVVGPKGRISSSLESSALAGRIRKELILLEQWDSLLENAWNTFLATLGAGRGPLTCEEEELLRQRHEDRAALVLGSDMPLLTPYELEEFVDGCDLDRYDFFLGTTSEEVLRAYGPQAGAPGVRFAHFCFRESKERQNNLHLIRFFRVMNRHYAQIMYRYRYQRRWVNVFTLFTRLLRLPEVRAGMVARFFLLHAARIADQRGWRGLLKLARRALPKSRIEQDISCLLQTRFASVPTTYGGAALDVDNEEHFEVIRLNFERWRAYQEDLHARRTRGTGSGIALATPMAR
jgi:hypothetical protein